MEPITLPYGPTASHRHRANLRLATLSVAVGLIANMAAFAYVATFYNGARMDWRVFYAGLGLGFAGGIVGVYAGSIAFRSRQGRPAWPSIVLAAIGGVVAAIPVATGVALAAFWLL